MKVHIALGAVPAKTLREAALVPEVRGTLERWIKAQPATEQGVLIGGLALSFYARPRQTQDVDLLFADHAPSDLNTTFFKRTRDHAAIDKKDHVELEFVTHKTIGVPKAVTDRVIETAWSVGPGQPRVASLDSMIVLKLYGSDTARRHLQDSADIQAMLEHNRRLVIEELIDSWGLSEKHAQHLRKLHELATGE